MDGWHKVTTAGVQTGQLNGNGAGVRSVGADIRLAWKHRESQMLA